MQNKIFVTISVAYINQNLFFRMEMNKALKVSCDFNSYLVCQIPDNIVELKIKTTRGKYTLIKDAYTRTERYCPWDRANRGAQIHTRRRRTPQKEIKGKDTTIDNSTSSETDIPNGEGFGYVPKNFTDPNSPTETEHSAPEGPQKKFIGEYCAICIKKYERCWCNGSDWDADPMDIEQPSSPATNPNKTNQQPLLINNTKDFLLETDTSREGLGAVLSQKQEDGRFHLVAYDSQVLTMHEKNYHSTKLEFLTLKWAIMEHFKEYLLYQPFLVKTDNNPLTYIMTTPNLDATGHQ